MRPLSQMVTLALVLRGVTALAQAPDSGISPHSLVVGLSGGVEGFSGPLGRQLNSGVTYGLDVALPLGRFVGVELGYSGTVAALRRSPSGTVDVSRDGVYLAVTPGFEFGVAHADKVVLRPHVLGGLGLDSFNAHDNGPAAGFTSQTNGAVLFGMGIALRVLPIVASLRFTEAYDCIGPAFNPIDKRPFRYQAQLLVGTTF